MTVIHDSVGYRWRVTLGHCSDTISQPSLSCRYLSEGLQFALCSGQSSFWHAREHACSVRRRAFALCTAGHAPFDRACRRARRARASVCVCTCLCVVSAMRPAWANFGWLFSAFPENNEGGARGGAVEGYARVCCYQRTYNPSQLMAARAAAPVRAHKGGGGGSKMWATD